MKMRDMMDKLIYPALLALTILTLLVMAVQP